LTLKQYRSRFKFDFGSVTNPLIFFILFFSLALSAQGQKNDTIYLINGDRLTGELKKFEYGQLTLSTDAMLIVTIRINDINTIYSAKYFEVLTKSGFRYFGSLLPSNTPATVNVVISNDTVPKPLWDIVQITNIKDNFFKRIDGNVSLGLSYTKASDVFQYNLATTVMYRTKHYSTRFDLSSILTDQTDKERSNNSNIGLNVTRYLPNKWFARVLVNGQQNTELDLKLRLQGGLSGGYDIIRSNSVRFYGLLGLTANNEQTIDSAITSNNLEIQASTQFKLFKYRTPKIDVTNTLNFYYSVTISNRYRLEYDLSAKFEIVKDLYFNLTIYDSYDSKPFTGETAKNDWGVITSLEYKF
jgi:hypothetical protein